MRRILIIVFLIALPFVYLMIYRVRLHLSKKNEKLRGKGVPKPLLFDYYNLLYFLFFVFAMVVGYIAFSSVTIVDGSGENYQRAILRDGKLIKGQDQEE